MKLHLIPFTDIVIPPSRQRRELNFEELTRLAASIADVGLIHPIVVRKDESEQWILVAGERRLRALEYIWNFGQELRCGEQTCPEGSVPCLYLGELDPLEAFEVELEENIRRLDLSWQEKAAATAQLVELRSRQAALTGEPQPSTAELAAEFLPPGRDTTKREHIVLRDTMLAKALDDPDVSRAKTAEDALKILKRKEETARFAAIGAQLPSEVIRSQHRLMLGNCLDLLPLEASESFDVILTDPPYGINAHDFNDSGSQVSSLAHHAYDDSPAAWAELIKRLCPELYRVAKPLAHLYIFCDIENFPDLRFHLDSCGWNSFRTPLIWVNPSGVRAPWPESGPQRKWQAICYAVKGKKPCTRIYGDVITVTLPPEQNSHPARKPPGLLADLLRRSCQPGDTVLDPFCGGGSIFPAAQELKVIATGIELDKAYYGMASQRLGRLSEKH